MHIGLHKFTKRKQIDFVLDRALEKDTCPPWRSYCQNSHCQSVLSLLAASPMITPFVPSKIIKINEMSCTHSNNIHISPYSRCFCLLWSLERTDCWKWRCLIATLKFVLITSLQYVHLLSFPLPLSATPTRQSIQSEDACNRQLQVWYPLSREIVSTNQVKKANGSEREITLHGAYQTLHLHYYPFCHFKLF